MTGTIAVILDAPGGLVVLQLGEHVFGLMPEDVMALLDPLKRCATDALLTPAAVARAGKGVN